MVQSPKKAQQFDLVAPAHRFKQGGRYVYSFILDLPRLNRLLPNRVDEKVIREANRRLTPSHAAAIQSYLESENRWILGTLMMGANPKDIEFLPYPGQESTKKAVIVGQLSLSSAAVKIFDGQHRRRAIQDAMKSLRGNPRKKARLATLLGASVPVMLYAESNVNRLRQMFADAAQTKTIERNTVAVFDRRDAFNQAADQLCEISRFLKGRVEFERASVPRTSPTIISINQLAATLKTVAVGVKGRVTKRLNEDYLSNVDALVDQCCTWSDEFMPASRKEYGSLFSGEIENIEIPDLRSDTMAFNATTIRLLAGCYHEWVKGGSDWKPLADFIRSASFKPGSRKGALLVDAGVVIPGGRTPSVSQKSLASAVDYIVKKAKVANR